MTDNSPASRRKRHSRTPFGAIILLLTVALIICIAVIIKQSSTEDKPPASSEVSTVSGEYSEPDRSDASLDNSIPEIDAQVPDKNSTKSKVMVIATGGTIAGIAPSSTDFTLYTPGVKSIDEMLDEISAVYKLADIDTKQFANQSSSSTTTKNLYDLSVAVDNALETYDSVVVTCGTDIMEEIAYFLDLTVQSPKPVVVTGSMKPWNVIGTDAKLNLYNAVKVAASNKTYKFGTVVVLNEEIHAAREVTKANSVREDTFQTPMLGMLGYVDDNDVSIYRIPTRAAKSDSEWATPFDLSKISASDLPRVDIVVAYQGAGGEQITAAVNAGAKGIVTMGTGNGGITTDMITARNAAMNKGIIIAAVTRTGSGTMYSEDRDGYGLVSADNLNAYHARIALQLCLAYSKNYNTIQGWFDDYIRVGF